MPELRPFNGLRYAPADPATLAALLCPPYDVISSSERARLAAADPNNAVHLELPQAPADDPAKDGYAHAARLLDEWVESGALVRDQSPAIYVYEQRFTLDDGSDHVARSFFARLRLEPYAPWSGVRPHELTMSAPKEDRFRLLSATRTNLSPVMLQYDDRSGGAATSELLDELTLKPAVADAQGPGGVGQRLWLATPQEDPAAAELIRLAAVGPLDIADGHHRYETALRYQAQPGAPEGADFVLALLYEAHSGGLQLLPWHRLISGVTSGSAVIDAARGLYSVEPVASSAEIAARLNESTEAGLMGLWTRDGGALLQVERGRIDSRLGGGSDELRWLDVNVLSATLREMTGNTTDELLAAERLAYVSDAAQAVAAIDAGNADVAFLLRPTPIDSVLAVAANGEHMPAKSTFFHPKAATGLVFNRLD
ncbi:MAG TPA: DUF1015 domain-containing protein [Candidatus Limnocylindrales bacterium]|nr:DUF1015 domain-containing protein [Candidatus Limnocylindrales bacterium]